MDPTDTLARLKLISLDRQHPFQKLTQFLVDHQNQPGQLESQKITAELSVSELALTGLANLLGWPSYPALVSALTKAKCLDQHVSHIAARAYQQILFNLYRAFDLAKTQSKNLEQLIEIIRQANQIVFQTFVHYHPCQDFARQLTKLGFNTKVIREIGELKSLARLDEKTLWIIFDESISKDQLTENLTILRSKKVQVVVFTHRHPVSFEFKKELVIQSAYRKPRTYRALRFEHWNGLFWLEIIFQKIGAIIYANWELIREQLKI